MWSDQCLEVDGCSSVDGLESQQHRLEPRAGRNRKPVEVMEERIWEHTGEFEYWIPCGRLVAQAGPGVQRNGTFLVL